MFLLTNRKLCDKMQKLRGGHMAKKKVFAVKRGKTTGLFYSWAECQESVNGYPGAEFKGFSAEEEAKAYLEGKETAKIASNTHETLEEGLIVYVDGSFDEKIGKYSFGCIILTPNGETIKESGNGDNPESLAIRNVAGEMLGAMYAVKWAIKNGYISLDLRYDYEGIEKWATGEWKAKNTLTQKYAEFMKEHQKHLNIKFTKIKAHTGDFYNEEVDKLAKAALTEGKGIPKIKRGDFWFTVEGITEDDLIAVLGLVKEEIGSDKIAEEEKSIAHGKSISLKISNKDRVVVSHYSKSNTVVMQGKPQLLFSTIISYITELVDIEEIPKIFNNTYNVSIDKDEVCSEFQFYMPNSFDKFSSKMEKALLQAVYNLKLNGKMFDGTFLAHPAMRVVEAHLKILLVKYEIIPDAKYIKDNGFNMFDKLGAKYKLKMDQHGTATEDKAKYIGNLYTFYHNNRHVLFHWDDPTGPLDTTKLLSVEDAHDKIKRALAIIDEYYE